MSVLDDKFNMYYSAARKAYSAGNGAQAKRNYMLAAETLLQLAKLSTPRLKEARVQRAKRLLEIAENIDGAIARNKFPAGSAEDEKEEDGGREWTAAEVPDIHFSDIAGLEDVKKGDNRPHDKPRKIPRKVQTVQ